LPSDDVLKRNQPEVALIMLGTNDISGGKVGWMSQSAREDARKPPPTPEKVPDNSSIRFSSCVFFRPLLAGFSTSRPKP
jgi:hypothetical protein